MKKKGEKISRFLLGLAITTNISERRIQYMSLKSIKSYLVAKRIYFQMALIRWAKNKIFSTEVPLASDPNTPEEILTMLSEREYWYIRYAAAGNPNLSKEALTKLTEDEETDVKVLAIAKLKARSNQQAAVYTL